jgi:predicted RND superfamily exporter protein
MSAIVIGILLCAAATVLSVPLLVKAIKGAKTGLAAAENWLDGKDPQLAQVINKKKVLLWTILAITAKALWVVGGFTVFVGIAVSIIKAVFF